MLVLISTLTVLQNVIRKPTRTRLAIWLPWSRDSNWIQMNIRFVILSLIYYYLSLNVFFPVILEKNLKKVSKIVLLKLNCFNCLR